MFIVDVQNIQTSLGLKVNSIVSTILCLQHAHLSAGFPSEFTKELPLQLPEDRVEITASKGSITAFHECVVSETYVSEPLLGNGLFRLWEVPTGLSYIFSAHIQI
jgi:hypothetical protein